MIRGFSRQLWVFWCVLVFVACSGVLTAPQTPGQRWAAIKIDYAVALAAAADYCELPNAQVVVCDEVRGLDARAALIIDLADASLAESGYVLSADRTALLEATAELRRLLQPGAGAGAPGVVPF